MPATLDMCTDNEGCFHQNLSPYYLYYISWTAQTTSEVQAFSPPFFISLFFFLFFILVPASHRPTDYKYKNMTVEIYLLVQFTKQDRLLLTIQASNLVVTCIRFGRSQPVSHSELNHVHKTLFGHSFMSSAESTDLVSLPVVCTMGDKELIIWMAGTAVSQPIGSSLP